MHSFHSSSSKDFWVSGYIRKGGLRQGPLTVLHKSKTYEMLCTSNSLLGTISVAQFCAMI